MKNVAKFLFSFLAWVVVAGMLSAKMQAIGVNPIITVVSFAAITFFLAGFDKEMPGVYKCETVNVISWQNMIIKRLWKDNAFLKMCVRADEFVVANTAVVIPQIGAAPTVIKNNTVFPLTAVQRGDTVVMYALNTYVTTPTFVTLDELEAISYNKAETIYDDHFKTLVQTCADDQLVNWANGLPGANVIYTSGAATNTLEAGQVGSRNVCTVGDVKKLQRVMNKANVDPTGRVIMMEANMYDQFTDSLSITQQRDFSNVYDPKTGVVGSLFGFDFMTRSSVLQAASAFDGSGNLAVNALGAALGATDNIGCLAWQKNSIELAMGGVHVFNRLNDPLYTGDINNCRIKAGGRVRRADCAGVYALMQGTPAGV